MNSRVFTILISVLLFGINLFLTGLEIGIKSVGDSTSMFVIYGNGGYFWISYLLTSLFLSCFIIGKQITHEKLSNYLCLVSLALSLFYSLTLGYRLGWFLFSDEALSVAPWLSIITLLNWINIPLLVILFIYQIIVTFQHFILKDKVLT